METKQKQTPYHISFYGWKSHHISIYKRKSQHLRKYVRRESGTTSITLPENVIIGIIGYDINSFRKYSCKNTVLTTHTAFPDGILGLSIPGVYLPCLCSGCPTVARKPVQKILIVVLAMCLKRHFFHENKILKRHAIFIICKVR